MDGELRTLPHLGDVLRFVGGRPPFRHGTYTLLRPAQWPAGPREGHLTDGEGHPVYGFRGWDNEGTTD
jgi:hypothetical protein